MIYWDNWDNLTHKNKLINHQNFSCKANNLIHFHLPSFLPFFWERFLFLRGYFKVWSEKLKKNSCALSNIKKTRWEVIHFKAVTPVTMSCEGFYFYNRTNSRSNYGKVETPWACKAYCCNYLCFLLLSQKWNHFKQNYLKKRQSHHI